ncbi:Kdo-III transferase WaaZ [Mycoplana sp. BE70]|uniref:glycosyl transferase n=1 Tax=Mycoplana sp. BE70 TaxID=2817775 RepID=UPI00285BDDB0|nr:glycosyl transferase [Mycoplana sp. BE70]MDR6757765.1 Kdo-III transferase WaaZ [Mycoplana sp. BE70]
MRKLIKVGARVLLGKAYAHAQDAFPGLRISAAAAPSGTRQVEYRGRQVAVLHDVDTLRRYAARSLCILGSGPSMLGSRPGLLAPHSALALNGAISLFKDEVTQPLAVVIEDERFVFRHFALMREKIAAGQICLFSVSVLRAVCEQDAAWLADKHLILVDNILKPYRARRRSFQDVLMRPNVVVNATCSAGLSLDPNQGVFQAGSVAVSAFQFALCCRPESIGFMGIDISNAAGPRFYEQPGGAAYSGVARAQARILDHFALGVDVARQRGTRLLNFSPTSALEELGLAYDDRFSRDYPAGPDSIDF